MKRKITREIYLGLVDSINKFFLLPSKVFKCVAFVQDIFPNIDMISPFMVEWICFDYHLWKIYHIQNS